METDLPETPYLKILDNNRHQLQADIERILEKYRAQPVGSGYIDLILNCDDATKLIDELASLNIAVQRLTWWCHCTPESELKLGCPHGYGGPRNRLGIGWFSECVNYSDFVLTEQGARFDDSSIEPNELADACKQLTINYLQNTLPNENFYSPCLHTGIWLYVPKDWRRKYYWLSG
jgi:hypothetical protein